MQWRILEPSSKKTAFKFDYITERVGLESDLKGFLYIRPLYLHIENEALRISI